MSQSENQVNQESQETPKRKLEDLFDKVGSESDEDSEEPEEPPMKKRRKPLARKRDVHEVPEVPDRDPEPSLDEQIQAAKKSKMDKAIDDAKKRDTPVTDDEVNSHVLNWVDKFIGNLEEEFDAADAFRAAGVKEENNIPEMVSERVRRMLSIWQVALVEKIEESEGEFSESDKELMKDIHEAIHQTIKTTV